jgi:methyl-accepting chemotaxis protein
MDEIVGQVKRVTALIGEISTAGGAQASGIAEVSGAVTQIDETTQANAALVEQSAAAAEGLRQQAAALAKAVAVFRVA